MARLPEMSYNGSVIVLGEFAPRSVDARGRRLSHQGAQCAAGTGTRGELSVRCRGMRTRWVGKGRGGSMLGPLIVCYLFLGGTGAGACLVLAALGLLAPGELVAVRGAGGDGAGRRPAGAHAVLRPPAAYRRLLAPGYRAAPVALALGMVCLLADVGRADRCRPPAHQPGARMRRWAPGRWRFARCWPCWRRCLGWPGAALALRGGAAAAGGAGVGGACGHGVHGAAAAELERGSPVGHALRWRCCSRCRRCRAGRRSCWLRPSSPVRRPRSPRCSAGGRRRCRRHRGRWRRHWPCSPRHGARGRGRRLRRRPHGRGAGGVGRGPHGGRGGAGCSGAGSCWRGSPCRSRST